jgi:Cellulase (glycosyl hydrolase family 5)/Calx-beta domain
MSLSIRNAALALAVFLSACSGAGKSSSTGSVTNTPSAPAAAGTLALSATSFMATQSSGTIAVMVMRAGGSGGAVAVDFATSDGTAVAGGQYTTMSTTLNWADGDTSTKAMSIPISNATPFSGTKTFNVTLSAPSGGAALGTPAAATVSINGDAVASPPPAPGTVALTAASSAVGQGAGTVNLTVARTGGSSGAVSIAYATSDGTAHASTDYTSKSGSLNWASGDSAAKSIAVAISNSTPFSGSRSFTVTLSTPGGGVALGTPASASVAITGDAVAPPGSLALSASSYSANQNAGTLAITVTRTGGSKGIVGVSYTTIDGTALAGTNYTKAASTLQWADGDSSAKSFNVSITASPAISASKAFSIALSNATGSATLATPSSATVTINPNSSVSGAMAIKVQGNKFVDGSGKVVQLRGVDYGPSAYTPWNAGLPDPWGGTPPLIGPAAAWKANAWRVSLNEASWLADDAGQATTCMDSGGASHIADPWGSAGGKTYQQYIAQEASTMNAAGFYVILVLHYAAPDTHCPQLQTQMADADHSPAFWASVAKVFKNTPGVMFELYNEPYNAWMEAGQNSSHVIGLGSATTPEYTGYPSNPNYRLVNMPWAVASMQTMITAIRATGATNVVLVGTDGWDDDLTNWLVNVPTDPIGQMAATWHPYPPIQFVQSVAIASGGTGYSVGDTVTFPQVNPGTGAYGVASFKVSSVNGGAVTGVSITSGGSYVANRLPANPVASSTTGSGKGVTFNGTWAWQAGGNSLPSTSWPVTLKIAATYPVIFTETGDHDTAGTVGAPWLSQLLPWADQNGLSYMGWWFLASGEPDDVLIKDNNGTPTDGYGQYYHDHLICVAAGTANCP